jgi:competence protein ComGB
LIKKNNNWRLEEQALFLRQLSTLLDRGYPLIEGFSFLMLHLSKKKQKMIEQSLIELKEGTTFHEVLFRQNFHRDVLGFIYFAENHGNMSFALREGSTLLEHKVLNKQKMLKLIKYPLFLVTITLFLLIMMNVFLFPQLLIMLENMNVGQSSFLRIVLFIVKTFPLLLLITVISLVLISLFFWIRFIKTPITTRITWLSLLPVYGPILKMFYSQYFAMQLSQLIQGGLSIQESLSIFEDQQHFLLFKVEATKMKQELSNGDSLSEIIRNRGYFEEELSRAISFGSKNGELSRELFFYSKISFQKLETYIQKRIAIIQPTVFIMIASFIMLMYFAIMQPMFQLLNNL